MRYAADLLKAAATHVPTVAVDLDGTLAENVKPFRRDVIGKPRPRAVRWLKRFKKLGARVIVFTVRGDEKLVRDWCDEHGVPVDYVNENPNQPPGASGKVLADVYLDDRAIDASGDWDDFGPEVEERLEAA